jgi:hypothetical protein
VHEKEAPQLLARHDGFTTLHHEKDNGWRAGHSDLYKLKAMDFPDQKISSSVEENKPVCIGLCALESY